RNMKNKVFFLKNSLFRRAAVIGYKGLLKNQNFGETEIRKLNFEKRRQIVAHAYNHSAFYKSHYQKFNFSPDDLKTESDWDKVPVLTRKDIVENEKDIVVKGTEGFLYPISTGGSSGVPLKVFHDKRFPSE